MASQEREIRGDVEIIRRYWDDEKRQLKSISSSDSSTGRKTYEEFNASGQTTIQKSYTPDEGWQTTYEASEEFAPKTKADKTPGFGEVTKEEGFDQEGKPVEVKEFDNGKLKKITEIKYLKDKPKTSFVNRFRTKTIIPADVTITEFENGVPVVKKTGSGGLIKIETKKSFIERGEKKITPSSVIRQAEEIAKSSPGQNYWDELSLAFKSSQLGKKSESKIILTKPSKEASEFFIKVGDKGYEFVKDNLIVAPNTAGFFVKEVMASTVRGASRSLAFISFIPSATEITIRDPKTTLSTIPLATKLTILQTKRGFTEDPLKFSASVIGQSLGSSIVSFGLKQLKLDEVIPKVEKEFKKQIGTAEVDAQALVNPINKNIDDSFSGGSPLGSNKIMITSSGDQIVQNQMLPPQLDVSKVGTIEMPVYLKGTRTLFKFENVNLVNPIIPKFKGLTSPFSNQRFSIKSNINQKSFTSLKNVLKIGELQKTNLRQKTKTSNKQKTNTIISTNLNLKQGVLVSQRLGLLSGEKTKITNQFISPLKSVGLEVPNFDLKFKDDSPKKLFQSKRKTDLSFNYAPSLSAIISQKTTRKKPKKKFFTGFEIRPIISSKKKRKNILGDLFG